MKEKDRKDTKEDVTKRLNTMDVVSEEEKKKGPVHRVFISLSFSLSLFFVVLLSCLLPYSNTSLSLCVYLSVCTYVSVF